MKKYKEELDRLQSEEESYIIKKAQEYQKRLKFENEGGGWNDTTDGFRHVWGAAYLALKYGDLASHAATSIHEALESSYQPKEEQKMDEWNNELGREIAKDLKKEYKDIEKSFQWPQIEDLIAMKTYEKIQESKVISSPSDERLNNGFFKLNAVKNNTDSFYTEKSTKNEPQSLKDKLIKFKNEKLTRYTDRLARTPQEQEEQESKHVTLEELKAPQEAKKQKVRDIVEGKVQFDEEKDLSGYVNKKTGDNKIFTQEEIDAMTPDEQEKNKEAIFYQKQTIGVPSKEQADRAVSKGEMVYVSSYTRADGTKVKSYYRSR